MKYHSTISEREMKQEVINKIRSLVIQPIEDEYNKDENEVEIDINYLFILRGFISIEENIY